MILKTIFKQFKLDLPRLTLYIDNQIFEKDYKTVSKFLFKNFERKEAKICIYFLTQNSLANFYINEKQKLFENNNIHLIDDGNFIVKIFTKNKTIEISKKFRKIYLDDTFDNFELDFAELNIYCDIKTKKNYFIWSYEFEDYNTIGVVDIE